MTALRLTPILHATLCFSLLCNCTSDDRNLTIPSEGPWNSGVYLEPEPFEQGDAAKGWYSLLHGNYMSCGIPYKLWANEWVNPTLRDGLGAGASAATIPERTGKNADMPYAMNAFTTSVIFASSHSSNFPTDCSLSIARATISLFAE